MAIMSEAHVQKAVMLGLIGISSDYWANFLQYEPANLGCDQKRFTSCRVPNSNNCLNNDQFSFHRTKFLTNRLETSWSHPCSFPSSGLLRWMSRSRGQPRHRPPGEWPRGRGRGSLRGSRRRRRTSSRRS